MERRVLKTAAFGGFDKQDVAKYIEQITQENAEQSARTEQEKAALQKENETLQWELSEARTITGEQSARLEELERALEEAKAWGEQLAECQARVDALTAKVAELEPDARSYRQFRDRLGSIECDARARAAELERSTYAKLRLATAGFRESYRSLSAALDAASVGVSGELRRIDEAMAQMPRSLERISQELKSLDDTLEAPQGSPD